ncbi:MAG TPA: histidine kinase [Solirubrobacteraceae bacterium]|nr:histidine kinase [Solirubrobacteraceae bacterium]
MAPARADWLVSLAAGVLGAGSLAALGAEPRELAVAVVLAGALGLAASRPRATGLVALITLLAVAPIGAVQLPIWLLVCAHAFYAARYGGTWIGLVFTAGLIGALELGIALAHQSWFVPAFFIPAAGWAAGWALGERERVVAQLAQRARELDEEREAHTRLAVRYDRARIASELHDIVAHALSVMVVQALAGQRLAARDPDLTLETFATIAGAARQAESDLGLLVALLNDESAVARAPNLDLVEELVERAAASGLDITLRLEGDHEGLPGPIAQAACRIVQEGLTNALRHAPGASVVVLLRSEPASLGVEIASGPAVGAAALSGAGTGNGLRGLRELVATGGGTLKAGPADGGGWLLTAHLPRRSASPGR